MTSRQEADLDFANHSQLETLVGHILAAWPEHRSYIEKSFANRTDRQVGMADRLADIVLRLAKADTDAGLDGYLSDYRFLCEKIVLPEELHFRRKGAYRLSKFEDANRECYANKPFMTRYMNGLLVSYVVWANHCAAFDDYVHRYLPMLEPGAAHLEIGPGHGAFLYFAAQDAVLDRVHGWDISPASIAQTRHALDALGVSGKVGLSLQDMFDAGDPGEDDLFDSVVMSEILEHLEDPVAAMKAAAQWLKPGGRLWINVPANSPAPDHIFLVDGIDHAANLVEQAGFDCLYSDAFPMSGLTLEQAVRRKMAVSCIVLGQKQ